jgi:nucleoside-diphosphate-sugar epimerase
VLRVTTLVTGATGRIGSRFVPRLLAEREEVRVLIRDAGRAASLRECGAEPLVGDLREAAVLRRVVDGVDAIVHLGASFRGASEEEMGEVNRAATSELARAALNSGVRRFVFVSTNLVYGRGRGRPVLEDDPPAPVGAYPASKAAAEADLRDLHRSAGLDLRVVRLAFVYGDGDPHLRESLLWAASWPAHKTLHMIHHADVAQALIRALRADGVEGETFNAADDAPVTAFDLHRINDEPIATEAVDRSLADPWEGIVDTTKIRRRLGFRPIYPTLRAAAEAGAL